MNSTARTLIVLFSLKPGADRSRYEAWARTTDLPIVRALPSVGSFEIFRSASLLGTDAAPPYDYVEVIEIGDMPGFGGDVASETMRRVAGEFREFAADPVFMLTDRVS